MVLVGDFWQLKPIPNSIDAGVPIFESDLFKKVFPHRYELKEVLRQGQSEVKLKRALDQIRMGQCHPESEAYLSSLSRECSLPANEVAIHIYFKRLPVDIHNAEVLASLDGSQILFESRDTGQAKLLDKTIDRLLHLKPGCRIMLLYNINDQLKNGCCGVFVGVQSEMDDDRLLVDFPGVGVVKLDRRTWYKYDKDGNILGSRTQYPLCLCYAIRLTIDKVVIVHCSQEFIPGQTYVALSRVRREATLQVIGFRKRFLLPAPASLSDISSCPTEVLMPSFHCCKAVQLHEAQCDIDELSDTCFENGRETVNTAFFDDRPEGVERDEPENTKDDDEVTLEDVLLCVIEHVNNKLSSPPFSVKEFLESLIKAFGDRSDAMSKPIACAVLFALDNLETFRLLSDIIWCRISEMFQNYLAENLEETRMTNAKFTFTTAKINELFFTSCYRCDLMKAFNAQEWQEVSDGQRAFGMKLVFHLHHLFTNEVGKLVQKQEEEPIPFQVASMGPEGRGKIRYIGGWAVRKSLEKSRNYATTHKTSSSSDLLTKVRKEVTKAQLLEDNVIVPLSVLQSSTSSPETLNVVESRQFRERGLLHITDRAHEFFMSLEQKRVEKINTRRLESLKAEVIQISIDEVSRDENLEAQFINCFELDQENQQVRIIF